MTIRLSTDGQIITVFDANDSSGLPSLMYSVSNDVDNSEETNDLVVLIHRRCTHRLARDSERRMEAIEYRRDEMTHRDSVVVVFSSSSWHRDSRVIYSLCASSLVHW